MRVRDGSELARQGVLRTQVCVVGSGAGGAALACGLAERGIAVTVLEEGKHVLAADFPADPLDAVSLLYRGRGVTGSLGVPCIPIAMGRVVGGTTTVNAGTCLRPPPETLERWARVHGLTFAAELDRYFAQVERDIGASVLPEDLLGGTGEIVRRGARALGYRGFAPPRNALGCRGEGRCIFGCPHDAKRGAALTYLPRAAAAGAEIFSRCRATAIRDRHGRPEVALSTMGPGHRRAEIVVRAEAVVVCGGALPTPDLLLASGLGGSAVGRYLHLHPASRVMGVFEDVVLTPRGTLQSYVVDQCADDGILMETVLVPPPLLAPAVPGFGDAHAAWMRRHANIAILGVMVSDQSSGRVRRGRWVGPFVTYRLAGHDLLRLRRAIAEAARVLLAAGAREVIVGIHGAPSLRGASDVEALLARPVRAGDLEMQSMHPHGSCRMGTDRLSSVVGPDFAIHGMPRLRICDASVLPEALGVNPQVTIMALALRCAEVLSESVRRGTYLPGTQRPTPLRASPFASASAPSLPI